MKACISVLFLLLAFDLVSTSPSSWYNYNNGDRYGSWDNLMSEEYYAVDDDTTSKPETTTPMTKATKSTTKTARTTTPTPTLQPQLKSTPAETDADLIAMLGKMAADFVLNGTDHQTNSSQQKPKTKSTVAEKTDADMIAAFVNEVVAVVIDELDDQTTSNSSQTSKTKSTVAGKTDADMIAAFVNEMVAVLMDELGSQTNSSTQTAVHPKSESDADMIAALVKEVVAAVIQEIDSQTNSSTQTPKTKSTIAEKTDADMIAAFVNEVVAAVIDEIDGSQTIQTAVHPKSDAIPVETDAYLITSLVNEVTDAVIDRIDSQIDSSMKNLEQVNLVPAKEETKDCAKSKKTGQQFNPNCDLIQDYDIHQYQRQDHESWAVSFNLKNALRRVMLQTEAPSHYIVRYQKTDKPNVGETQFLVVPSNPRQNKIAVENLSPGIYAFQICASSASFKPSFSDSDGFSWAEQAPVRRLRLQSGSKEKKEAESTFGEKREHAW